MKRRLVCVCKYCPDPCYFVIVGVYGDEEDRLKELNKKDACPYNILRVNDPEWEISHYEED